MYLLKVISFYRLPGFIFLLGLFCGSVFAQNNVTVDGTVDVTGTVGIDYDPGQLQPTGGIGSSGEFSQATGISNSGGNSNSVAQFLWSDPSTWYTPRYFEYSRLTILQPESINLKSRNDTSGTYGYSYQVQYDIVLNVPVFNMNYFSEDFSNNLFGINENPLQKLKNLWTSRGAPTVHIRTLQGYMGDSSIEHSFDYTFSPMALANDQNFGAFVTCCRYLIQFIVSALSVSYALRVVTSW